MEYNSQIPIHLYPGGMQIAAPTENVTYKWIDSLGGAVLPGPLKYGSINPDGDPAKVGIATVSHDGHTTIPIIIFIIVVSNLFMLTF
ncbi:hypothetical protein QJ856_gp0325 [Tupanvirus deep ocean]|uniref:Uncharacterized protein n=2 Tax=Tupanvirus TaxID=2094720 RepID=A0AC62A9E7_9VIRU|nr:hypothetical protein QJ856_gp0325 [Tupanvirus deep ocean]QKU34411.1 hypothetical protein [Tupanvirus deep ocean]